MTAAAQVDWTRWLWGLGLAAVAAPLGLLAGIDPALAVVAALAAGFALIAFTDLTTALAAYIFISYFALHPFGLYDGMARLVLALGWFAVIATRGRGELELFRVHPWITTALGLFLGWAAASITWAESSSVALGAVEQYAACVVLLLVVFTAVRSRADLARVVTAFVLGTIAAAISGIIAPAASAEEIEGRLGTALLDPNVLAASLVSSLPLLIGLAAISRSTLTRWAIAIGCGFCAVALWLTGSRGGLISAAIVLIAAIFLAGRWRGQATMAAGVAIVATYVFFAGFAPDQLRERVTAPTQGEERVEEGRTTIWAIGLRTFEANPVEGVGAGNFRVSSRHFILQPGTLPRADQLIEDTPVVHNAYLEVLSELGLIGSALFFAVIASCLGAALHAARLFKRLGDHEMQAAAICIALALVGTLSANFFVSDEYSKQLWFLLALGPALVTIARAGGGSGFPVASDYTRRPVTSE